MRRMINDGWRFLKAEADSRYGDVCTRAAETVCLPYDWAISDPEDFYRDADGWYFKTLDAALIPEDHSEVFLHFDGVYMDCLVYLNGLPVAEHHYGYTAFDVPLEGLRRPGENEIAVQVRYRCPNSRWYSGAGIYRDVELWSFRPAHLVPDGIALRTKRDGDDWELTVLAETVRANGQAVQARLYDGERCLWQGEARAAGNEVRFAAAVGGLTAWSPEQPKLYRPVASRMQIIFTRFV